MSDNYQNEYPSEYPSNFQEEFGELALVIGDFHTSFRSVNIPENFKELLVPNKVSHVFCTGNMGTRDTLDWLKSLSSNCIIVKGDYDDEEKSFPEQKIIQVGNWKVGIIHGHQIIPWGDEDGLYAYQREIGVDLLIYGHTHQQHITKIDGKYFLNPGSATGAYTSIKTGSVPSFILLEFKEDSIVVYSYQLVQGKLIIENTVLPMKGKQLQQ